MGDSRVICGSTVLSFILRDWKIAGLIYSASRTDDDHSVTIFADDQSHFLNKHLRRRFIKGEEAIHIFKNNLTWTAE